MRNKEDLAYNLIVAAIAITILTAGIWLGATINGRHSEAYRLAAVQNAISHTLETSASGLSCKDSEIIETIKNLAQNGAHVKGFALRLDMGNTVGW